ncbi:MAG: hypothetical protein A2V79_05925 [Betaproteobacteria bacterium RBG_16_56_24]|nr:MAG: hypothetical protein A2V79_05925 [Betaproteobacteria bacterium RBG_16_56_24]
MITPQDIRAKALRHWSSYTYHRLCLSGTPWQAFDIPFGKPSGRELLNDFANIRDSLHELQTSAKVTLGYGYQIDFEPVAHRQLGEQHLPSRIYFETEQDFLRFIGKLSVATQFKHLAQQTFERHPALAEILHDKPRWLLDNLAVWHKLLSVAAWFIAHPLPDIFIRQIDLPGIDSKFIEQHKTQLIVLLDALLPPSAIKREAKSFERRYGLRFDQHLIRFRLLDPSIALAGLTDLTLPLEDFCRLELPLEYVFITENKVNGLAFPTFPGSMVIFSLGYGVGSLAVADWLKTKRIIYWGDLDTHGFEILSRLREIFPYVESMLMDRTTLAENRTLCVPEASPIKEIPTFLTDAEQNTFNALSSPDGIALRLEQERIPFGQIEAFLRDMEISTGNNMSQL